MKRILFDATILSSGLRKNSNRSGLFVTTREIFSGLSGNGCLEMDVYIAPSVRTEASIFIRKTFPGFRGKFVGGERSNCIGRLKKRLDDLREYSKHSLARRLLQCLTICCKAIQQITDQYARSPLKAEELLKYDVFFSPVFLAPHFIRHISLTRFTVLYDTIPKLFPGFSPFTRMGFSWTFDLIRHLNGDDHGFAISECTLRDFLKFTPRLDPTKFEVMPLAADRKLFFPCGSRERIAEMRHKYHIPDAPYLLSLCTIERRKNLIFALNAFAAYMKKHPGSPLVFVLAGGNLSRFQKDWRKALSGMEELRSRVFLPGYIDDDDLAPLYSGAEIFIYPSLYEGFGLPPLEAMQCGCPVLTSNTSSLPEVVGDAGLMVDPHDLDGAVSAMETILHQPKVRAELCRKGLERAASFSWGKTVSIIQDSIIRICSDQK